MSISIKDDVVEAKIRRLAAVSGSGVTEAVELAVDEALARRRQVSEEEQQRRRAAIQQIVEEVKALPLLDPRPIDELLYDRDGLPI